MKALQKLRELSASFQRAAIESPAKEAELLITESLQTDRSSLYTFNPEISEEHSSLLAHLAQRRLQGEPLQYIIGHVEFYGLTIFVGPGVLIPRPETELLAEEAIRQLKNIPHPSVLDLCTGSGCIALTVAKNIPEAVIYGTDRSAAAIDYAVRNADTNKVDNVFFFTGNLFQPVKGKKFHCLLANPPYIKRGIIPSLQKEIWRYEPHEALDGGEDGLEFYRKIFQEGPSFLHEEGCIILEIGHDQADEIKMLAEVAGLGNIRFLKDYSGIRRIFLADFSTH